MPRPKSAPDPYLLGKVSALYYLRDHTQQEIAERLRLSRPTISRLLREARDLGRTVRPGETIGMAWGTTLSAMVDAMVPMPTEGSRVVQILGGLGPPDAAEYGAVLARRLAHQLDAQAVLLSAPGVVATPAVRAVLGKDPHVRAALNELDFLDTVFVGLGSLASNAVLNDGH